LISTCGVNRIVAPALQKADPEEFIIGIAFVMLQAGHTRHVTAKKQIRRPVLLRKVEGAFVNAVFNRFRLNSADFDLPLILS
jgi:hypothetical protein